MYQSVREAFVEFSTQFEGRVRYMYVDMKDLVTIGIGNLIDPIALALPLPFVFKSDQFTVASQDDITADWNAVKSNPSLAQRGFRACDGVTKLMLTDDSIDTLVLSKLDSFATTLEQTNEFSSLDSWPADAQLGILSMAWAMGPAFGAGWPAFRTACANQDWTTAAANCRMNDADNPGLTPRNVANWVLFLNAAQTVAQQLDVTALQYVVSGSRPTIRAGEAGDNVLYLQTRLAALQYSVTATGTFDDPTVQAVMAFQGDQGLSADGIVGPSTWAALGTSTPALQPANAPSPQ
jgi:GH24 family phage-related lysozyme (muramidase)